jgi:4-deoxy-L-threo-5-hexosulose-uronate ketol-isomerase
MTTTNCEVRHAVGQAEVKSYDTAQLRKNFLVTDILVSDEINWVYSFYERFMIGGAVPTKSGLTLETLDQLKTNTFLERRELGIINVGGPGTVNVDGKSYQLAREEALYLGKDNKKVVFSSDDAKNPAKFYLNSTPAHKAFPNKKIDKDNARVLELGSQKTSNERKINQLIINSAVETCQLQMGLTRLMPGSVWNTMPAHQHDRRNEVYFYLDLPEDQTVSHFMGEPNETRHIFVANEQAVVSPPWSIHCGCGTSNYAFIWGMAGENLDYTDMDHILPTKLR